MSEHEILSSADVQELLNIGRSKLYELRNTDPKFPKPHYVSLTKPRWFRQELLDWLRTMPTHSPVPMATK